MLLHQKDKKASFENVDRLEFQQLEATLKVYSTSEGKFPWGTKGPKETSFLNIHKGVLQYVTKVHRVNTTMYYFQYQYFTPIAGSLQKSMKRHIIASPVHFTLILW